MEALPRNIQDETLCLEPEGVIKSDSKDITPGKTKSSEISIREEIIQGVNGQINIDSVSIGESEHSNESKSSQQKTYSPTLIETALKAMKNLFSPEKPKSKSTNALTPGKQHRSASGSPTSSICIVSKSELLPSDLGSENSLIFQTGENSLKNQLNLNQVGVLPSPLTVESHNNTDESFLTTVSIIEDSFHSAITSLDENGESVKLEANKVNSFLNGSQNFHVEGLRTETFENSDYCFENTTLRNGSFASESTEVGSISDLSKFESGECRRNSQINGFCNESFVSDSRKSTVMGTQNEILKENFCNGTTLKKNNITDFEVLQNGHLKEEESVSFAVPENTLIEGNVQAEIVHESNDTGKNIKMENLFLNKSFDTSLKIPSIGKFSEESSLENNSQTVEDEAKSLDLNSYNELRAVKTESSCGNSTNEQDICLENCISTTTIVLNSVDSVDLDQMLKFLKEDDSDINTNTSPISSADSIESAIMSSENLTEIQNLKKGDNFVRDKFASKNAINTEARFSVHKSPNKKSSISETDSSNSYPLIFNKNKLHKSDEFLNQKMSDESSEKIKGFHKKKSSLDVLLIDSSEASTEFGPNSDDKFKFNFGSEELGIQATEDLRNQNLGDMYKNESSKEPPKVSVISQQSYTILNTYDKSLNRPIIDSPTNIGKDASEKITFQAIDSNNCSTRTPTLDISVSRSYCNSSLGAADSDIPIQQKQSTPLWKAGTSDTPNQNGQMLMKPVFGELRFNSPEESLCEEKNKMQHLPAPSKFDFSSNEDPAEFSPVNPISENELLLSSSVESENGGNQPVTTLKSAETLSSKDSSEPIQVSSKIPEFKLNRLQEGITETSGNFNALNQTYEKKRSSPDSLKNATLYETTDTLLEKTFTKKIESSDKEKANQSSDVSGSPEGNEINKSFNQTFVSKGLNQTFDKKAPPTEPLKLNETFDKKLQEFPIGKTNQTMDASVESSFSDKTNQTFVKEKNGDSNQRKEIEEMSKTFEVTEVLECNKNVEVETHGNKQAITSNNPMESYHCYNQQVSDYIDPCHTDLNESFNSERSSNSSLVETELLTLIPIEGESLSRHQSLDDLAQKLGKLELNESSEVKSLPNKPLGTSSEVFFDNNSFFPTPTKELSVFPLSPTDEKLRCDPYLVQLIQEQFSSKDIEKICSVVDDFSSKKLNAQILKASEQFDKTFQENLSNAELKPSETELKLNNFLTPQSFDFLNSMQGKPMDEKWCRESLYLKFDPLVQPYSNSLIDFTKEGEAFSGAEKSPVVSQSSAICDQLLTISPQKNDNSVPPLVPFSQNLEANESEDKLDRSKELQNEIYFLKNLYAERERINKTKMEHYESQVTKLAGERCYLENKLKESKEKEKSLLKTIKEHTQSLAQTKIIMEEYVKVISKLISERETLKTLSKEQIETLSTEKDSYINHLLNTEAAFTNVYTKYEKGKKTIMSLKTNEVMFKSKIAEQAQKIDELKAKAKEAQEKAVKEFQTIQDELSQTKASLNQETTRLRAQLRKTELKVEALQESLEQKVKENQQLTVICDELIEGKK